LDGRPLNANDNQKYFFNELINLFRRELKNIHDVESADYTTLRRYKFNNIFGKLFMRNFVADWIALDKDVGITTQEQIDLIDYREFVENPPARPK
jgi:hypothetical protein